MRTKFENRAEEILGSLDGIKPVDPAPYFYTRLVARMEKELVEKKEPFFLLRPAFLTTSLSLLLIINMIFLFQSKEKQPSTTQPNNSATIESFADAYNFNSPSVYE